jgi:hypothetical protein
MIGFLNKAPLKGKTIVTRAFGKLEIRYKFSVTDTESHQGLTHGMLRP